MTPLLALAVALTLTLTVPVTVPPTPSRAFTLAGHVLSPDATPLPHATVRITSLDLSRPAALPPTHSASATTDAAGRFTIELPSQPPSVRVVVTAEGLAPLRIESVETVPRLHELGPLRLAPPVSLQGTVRGGDGEPLEGAAVWPRLGRDGTPFSGEPLGRTGPDGRFSIEDSPELVVGPVELAFGAPGHAFVVRRVDLADVRCRTQEVSLAPAEPLDGTVVGDDGAPLAGASIRLVSTRTHEPSFAVFGRADAGGRFTLARVPADRDAFAVEVSSEGSSSRIVPLADWPADGVVVLVKAVELSAESREEESSGPALAWVRIEAYTKAEGGGWRRAVDDALPPTDGGDEAWGRFFVPNADRVRLTATAVDGRRSPPAEVDPSSPERVSFTFAPRRSVSGTVDGGTPARRVDLERLVSSGGRRVVERSALTDDGGRFRFEGVEEGRYELRASAEGRASPRTSIVVEGSDVEDVALTTETAPSVRVLVDAGEESPAVLLPVEVWRYEPQGRDRGFTLVASGVTGADGEVLLGPLEPGVVVVDVRRPPSSVDGTLEGERTARRNDDLREHPGLVRLGAAGVARVELAPAFPARSVVSGVVTANGRPLSGARAALVPAEGATPATASADEEGRFRLVVDGGGEATLSLRDGTLLVERAVPLAPGGEVDVAITLVTGRVTGTVTTAEAPERAPQVILEREAADPVTGAASWTPAARVLLEEGAYAFDLVAAGRYRVRLEDVTRRLADVATAPFVLEGPEGVTVPPLDAPLGATLEVTLELSRPDGAPAGEAEDPGDERLPFATLEVSPGPEAPPFPHPVRGWFVQDKATVRGLRPGLTAVRVVPHGPFDAGDAVVVTLDEGVTTSLTVPITRRE